MMKFTVYLAATLVAGWAIYGILHSSLPGSNPAEPANRVAGSTQPTAIAVTDAPLRGH